MRLCCFQKESEGLQVRPRFSTLQHLLRTLNEGRASGTRPPTYYRYQTLLTIAPVAAMVALTVLSTAPPLLLTELALPLARNYLPTSRQT